MSSLYTAKQAAELGAKLRECVADCTLIRMMNGCFYFSGLNSFHTALTEDPAIEQRMLDILERESIAAGGQPLT